MCKVSLQTLEAGIQMNDELAAYLQGHPEMDVQVVTA
jgi:DNA polymerase-3 subunit alpha